MPPERNRQQTLNGGLRQVEGQKKARETRQETAQHL